MTTVRVRWCSISGRRAPRWRRGARAAGRACRADASFLHLHAGVLGIAVEYINGVALLEFLIVGRRKVTHFYTFVFAALGVLGRRQDLLLVVGVITALADNVFSGHSSFFLVLVVDVGHVINEMLTTKAPGCLKSCSDGSCDEEVNHIRSL